MGYAFVFEGSVYIPDGKSTMAPQAAEAYNRALEGAELEDWAKKPDRWQVYVTNAKEVTTWRGTVLGTIYYRHTYRGNIARNMTVIRFRGTNGADYYGRFGSDWSQLCRVRKAKPRS